MLILFIIKKNRRDNSANEIFKNHYSEFYNLRFLDLGCYGYEQYVYLLLSFFLYDFINVGIILD